MKRIVIILIAVGIVIATIFTSFFIVNKQASKNNKSDTIVGEIAQEEEILDECTDEYESMQAQNILETNASEERISPNCSFTQKIYYSGCKHTISNYLELPQDVVNLNKEELQEQYVDWEIEKFSSDEVILYKEKQGECGEHFVVRMDGENVVIYKILQDNKEELYEITGISPEYLTENDKINMKNGIYVI